MWLIEEQGYSASQIVISGNSAGSNLASALSLYLMQNGMPQPAGVALWTPWLDLTNSSPSTRNLVECILPNGPRDSVSGEDTSRHSSYAPTLEHITQPLVSPLFADPNELKMKNHPPIWIEIGDADRLRDEGLLHFVRLTNVGVPVRCELYAESTHLFAGGWYLARSVLYREAELMVHLFLPQNSRLVNKPSSHTNASSISSTKSSSSPAKAPTNPRTQHRSNLSLPGSRGTAASRTSGESKAR